MTESSLSALQAIEARRTTKLFDGSVFAREVLPHESARARAADDERSSLPA